MTSGVKASYGTSRRANDTQQLVTGEPSNENAISSGEANEATTSHQPSQQWSKHEPSGRKGRGKWDNKTGRKKKETGQNKNRTYGSWGDVIKLCSTRQYYSEFSPAECPHGEKCKFTHDLRKYLNEGKQSDLTTEFGGICPVWQEHGFCPVGWQCRFAGSHSEEVEHEDGRKELILIEDQERMAKAGIDQNTKAVGTNVYNVIKTKDRINLEKRRVNTERADQYAQWLTDAYNPHQVERNNVVKGREAVDDDAGGVPLSSDKNGEEIEEKAREETRASYKEPPFRPSEKRRLYYGPETPVLAPLTTQGNLPFRRLCVDLGAQVTWSEMAMGLPLIQGQKGEWALVKAHESEVMPPRLPADKIVKGYDNTKDMKFGVQIAANKPWIAFKATEFLAKYCPRLRAIDLNCGCPIDLVYESGAGSALLNNGAKLEKILRGMNTLSDDIPVQVKIRTGVKDNAPNAGSLAERLILGGQSAQEAGHGPCGIAAMTLHGRSRQQRYTKSANWEYIANVGAMIKELRAKQDELADTVREADPRDQANSGKVYFIGNGDVYSHVDYNNHIKEAGVDSVMIARGALIKPWIFEEIEKGQYLDKSATERLQYVEKFCKYGLDTWGSDEMGIGTTRRFLLEWLSFTYRYIPLGLLEHMPPKINERPPPFKGRDQMETLLASGNYRDWIAIRYALHVVILF
jgi:tRNA-dihydrouridine synthase 3